MLYRLWWGAGGLVCPGGLGPGPGMWGTSTEKEAGVILQLVGVNL